MTEIALLVVPYELGRLRDGVGLGPERILERGAVEALSRAEGAVRCETLELDENSDNEIDASFQLIRKIADRVSGALREGAWPIVLSGSCLASVGVVAGLGEPSPGVVWLDAHGDFNTPETTIYGYLDGMGLAILTGAAWQRMHSDVGRARPVPETATILAAARAFDEPEKERLESSSVIRLAAADLRTPERLLRAIGEMTPDPSGLYLHVDLDVLDPEEAWVNRYSAPGGVTANQLVCLVAAVIDSGLVRARFR